MDGLVTTPLLEVRELQVRFEVARRGLMGPRQYVQAVDRVSLEISAAETLGLVGESGSGKSTTGRAILQLVRPTGGVIRFEGQEVSGHERAGLARLRRHAQMIFQDPYGSLNARMSVAAMIREPLDIHRVGDLRSRRQRVAASIDMVGLPADAGARHPHEFSGGQRQRIGIARALALAPSLVICDEPVAALDVSIQAQVLQLLADLQGDLGIAYLFIAHDLNVVRHVCGVRPSCTWDASSRSVGRRRCSPSRGIRTPRRSFPRSRSPIQNENAPAKGSYSAANPSPTDPPSGCHFRTRCPYAQALCAEVEPALEEVGDGTSVACHFWRSLSATPNSQVSSKLDRASGEDHGYAGPCSPARDPRDLGGAPRQRTGGDWSQRVAPSCRRWLRARVA